MIEQEVLQMKNIGKKIACVAVIHLDALVLFEAVFFMVNVIFRKME